MENTKIQWADHTFNPWIGCTKVSPGCQNCYMFNSPPRRQAKQPYTRTSETYWKQPIKWNQKPWVCEKCGESWPIPGMHPDCDGETFHSLRIFPSLCDWLDPDVPIEWLSDFLDVIRITPKLLWILLTKRPGLFNFRMRQVIEFNRIRGYNQDRIDFVCRWSNASMTCLPTAFTPKNRWIGTSCEDQQRLDDRVPYLLNIPSKLHFVSLEPLLGPIDFTGPASEWLSPFKETDANQNPTPRLDWIIVGGESGKNARICSQDWIRQIVYTCQLEKTPCFVKQMGSNSTLSATAIRNWKYKHPKGGDPNEWSTDLRVQQYPTLR